MAARRRRDVWTQEAIRLGALIRGLQARGETQAKIGQALGVHQTYISYLANAPKGDPRGVGAEIIRKVLEEYRINPWYFYDFPPTRIPDWTRYIIEPGHSAPTPGPHLETLVRKKSPR
jgi:transcriptional regulator with XRE-family HTH domain